MASKPSFTSRLDALKRKVSDRMAENELSVDAKRAKKVEAGRKRRQEEKAAQLRADEKERSKTDEERSRDALLLTVKKGILEWMMKPVKVHDKPIRTERRSVDWLVEAGTEGSFTAKVLSRQPGRLRLETAMSCSPEREAAFQMAAGKAGAGFLTPHAILNLPASAGNQWGGVLLSRFDPDAKRVEPAFLADRLRYVADFLKKLHRMETTGLTRFFPWNVFTGLDDVKTLLGEARREAAARREEEARVSDGERAAVELLDGVDVEEYFEVASQWRDIMARYHVDDLAVNYVCHNRLASDSFSWFAPTDRDPAGSGGKFFLQNFEHAANGDRYYDLATFSRLNGLSDDQDTILVKCYFGTCSEKQLAVVKLLKAAGLLYDACCDAAALLLCPGDAGPPDVASVRRRFDAFAEKIVDPEFARYIGEELIRD